MLKTLHINLGAHISPNTALRLSFL
uniref:Uncharacterized protein n=1 Tax=Anguilla anguilla TaxID=7936 RepID=A0A0E9WHU7_ANGAN